MGETILVPGLSSFHARGTRALAKLKLMKAREGKAKALLNEAQKLHDNGEHAASVKKANEALGILKKK